MNLLWFPATFMFITGHHSRHYFKQLAIAVGLFIISGGLFATTSRGGIATWLLLAPVLLWAAYRHNQSRRHVVLIVLIAALAYLFSVLLLNANIADRSFQLDQDPSTSARLLLWQSSIKMLTAHPVIGSGWGTFTNYYPAYRVPHEASTAGFFAHNDYLQLATEGGIPALLLQICILIGILIQLKRSLRRVAEITAFERVTLLLGVLALFIHALVNFIFYRSLMNILAGLYLARAAQFTDKAHTLTVVNIKSMNAPLKYLFSGVVVAFISLPYGAHLLGQSINKQSNVTIENLLSDKFGAYQLAEYITVIQPQERISQETILQTAELALEDTAFINKVGKDFYHSLLDSTLQRFDLVRALNANDAGVGVRQAKILIRHHEAFDEGYAYKKAHQVLTENLSANPYHVDSIIALSRLQFLEGRAAQALHTIEHARAYILKQRDKQLIRIELLRQLAAPEVIAELDAAEKDLRKIRFFLETGKPLILPDNYFPQIDAKLDAIAHQIQQKNL
jgi:hypothetical protein